MNHQTHYQTLGLSRNASAAEIRLAFHKLALKYHPDRNSSAEDVELFKQITMAYDVLSDKKKRAVYDNALYGFVINPVDIKDTPEYKRRYGNSKRKHINKDQINQKIIHDYEKQLAKLSLFNRIAISVVGIFWGLQIIFSNWFMNEAGFEIIFMFAGSGIFLFSSYFLYRTVYIRLTVLNLKKTLPYNFENYSLFLFFGILLSGLFILIGITQYQKQYHLEHYAGTDLATIIDIRESSRVVYIFRVDGKKYQRTETVNNAIDFLYLSQKIPVKYSLRNPRISQLIIKDQNN